MTEFDEGFDALDALDRPRPLPPALRERLEAALVAEGRALPSDESDEEASSLAAADAPRAIPSSLRDRVEARLVGRGRRRVASSWLVAAVLTLLLAATGAIAVRDGDRPPSRTLDVAAPGEARSTAPTTAAAADVGSPATDDVGSTVTSIGARPGVVPGDAGPVAGSARTEAAASRFPPPPYATPGAGAGAAPAAAPAPAAAAPLAREDAAQAEAQPATDAIRFGVVRGDADQEAGFRAYVEHLNRGGGLNGRTVVLVDASRNAPAAGTVLTVNLSGAAIGAIGGAVLEHAAAPESVLRGDVFGFSSPPERQAHLVADAVFPSAAPGATAVVFHAGSGVFAGAVPDAIERVLRARGVTVTRARYDAGRPAVLPPADAAFLSLATDAARAWLDEARAAGYRPARGVAGVSTLHDERLLDALPDGAVVAAPYRVPTGAEGEAVRAARGGRISAGALHGWATAKNVAVALWRAGVEGDESPAEIVAALAALGGYDSGLAPPYEVRPGTRSRTPEAVVLGVRAGTFTGTDGFRRDPF